MSPPKVRSAAFAFELTHVDSPFDGGAYVPPDLHRYVARVALANWGTSAERLDLIGAALPISGALNIIAFAVPASAPEQDCPGFSVAGPKTAPQESTPANSPDRKKLMNRKDLRGKTQTAERLIDLCKPLYAAGRQSCR